MNETMKKNHLLQFLGTCKQVVEPGAELDQGIEKIRKRFAEVDPVYRNSLSFISFIQRSIPKVEIEPWQCMKGILDVLKHHSVRWSNQIRYLLRKSLFDTSLILDWENGEETHNGFRTSRSGCHNKNGR